MFETGSVGLAETQLFFAFFFFTPKYIVTCALYDDINQPAHPRSLTSNFFVSIKKLCIHHENILYNYDPLKPHFYVVKLGFTGYILFFLFLLKTLHHENMPI